MGELTSIILFFVLSVGLGFLIDIFIKNWKADFLEKLVIRIGAGILLIPFFGVIFNLISIPLHWISFLILSAVIFSSASYLRKNTLLEDLRSLNLKRFRLKRSHIYTFFILIIFAVSAYMYVSGSFNYPWFEDGDPYSYAAASKYISLKKTYSAPYYFTHFAEPYPQGYSIFMGVLNQTNDSIYWTLKYFNALIVSFSILFFFYFAKKLTKRTSSAFWASFILAAIPAWVSHFVFALNFNMALMFLVFYAFFSVKEDKRWKYPGAFFYAAILMTHFYTGFIISVILIIAYILRVLVYKDFSKDYLDIMVVGFLLSLMFWVPALARYWDLFLEGHQLGGLNTFLPFAELLINSPALMMLLIAGIIAFLFLYLKHNIWFGHVKKILEKKNFAMWLYLGILVLGLLILIIPSEKIIYERGSASRVYGFSDFFIAQKGNMINNPIGIGWVVMIIFIIGMFLLIKNFKKLFTEKNFKLLVPFSWTIFSFIGVMGASLSIGFVPFRMWTFFGMSLALVSGYSIFLILKAAGKNNLIKIALIALIVISAYYTSFVPKYWHNTAQWPDHQIMVPESQNLYIWMRNSGRIPKDSYVLNLCHKSNLMFGYDMISPLWSDPELNHKSENAYITSSLNNSLENNYNFLKKHNFEYTSIGVSCVAKFKSDQKLVNDKLQAIANDTRFNLVYNTESEFLFKIK
ncbi:hypothetical protein GF336_04950 [Candidatus Woesearchaeota archaeon]|nr:hypothetical protein [Candidatus Woesearchaeota archaeon]